MVCDFKECKQTFWAKFENLNVDFVENFFDGIDNNKKPLKCECCTKCFE